jgi:PAS domain-containing protein
MIKSFKAEEARLFLKKPKTGNKWQEWVNSSEKLQLHQIDLKSVEHCDSFKLHKLQNDYTRLILPIVLKNNEIVMFWLFWSKAQPDEWINDEELLGSLCVHLGVIIDLKLLLIKSLGDSVHLKTILDHIPFAIVIIDNNYSIEWTNRQFRKLFNVNEDEDHRCYEIIHGLRSPDSSCCMQESINKQCDMRFKSTGIEGRMLDIRMIPFELESGEHKIIELITPMHFDERQGNMENSRLYNALNPALTSVALLADIILMDPIQHLHVNNIVRIKGEILKMLAIFEQEKLYFGA